MKRSLILGILLVVLSACGGSPAASTSTTSGAASSLTVPDAAPAGGADAFSGAEAPNVSKAEQPPVDGQQNQAAPNAQAPAERLVIRTATLQLLVASVTDAEAQVRRLADTRGGFVLSSQSSGEDANRRATVSIKVPAGRFDDAITELGKIAQKVEGQDVQGQDVTDEYVDLESRLRNLRAVEARLQQFLTDAQRIDDLLQINEQLAETQGQIEQTVGRITYLKQSAAMSTITVSLYAAPVVEVVPDEGWSPATTARAAARTLIAFGQALATVAIVFAVWTPLWLPLVLVALWLRRRMRRPAPPAVQASQP